MSKTILITGVAGFAGSHFLEHILENTSWDIIGIDSLEHHGDMRRVNEIIAGDPELYGARFRFVLGDLAVGFADGLLKELRHIDYIVNMAAESHVDRSIDDPQPFVSNNFELMSNMLEFARCVPGLKAFIQISTDEVYGAAPEGTKHKEWSAILPSNPYSASKAAQEALAISYWRTYGVPIVITNCMNMFGERQDTEKFVPNLIKRIESGDPAIIHGTPHHVGSRFYLHARNHADALLFILNNLPPLKYGTTSLPARYNIVGDSEESNFDMAMKVAAIIDKPWNYELVDFHTARPGHDLRYALDGSKLKSFGWTPPLDFETSLRKTVQWSLKHKEWLI